MGCGAALSQFAVLQGNALAVNSHTFFIRVSLVSRLTSRQDMKKKVLEATRAAVVDETENGGLELHGRTYFAWSTAVPGSALEK